jgi:ribosomal protein S18 acetylase RimI-like enzyme
MQVEAADPHDLHEIARLHVRSWQAAYTGIVPQEYLASLSVERREQGWRQVLAEGRSELLVAKVDGGAVGFASYGASRDADAQPATGELWALYVAPESWRARAGSALWLAARARLLQLGFVKATLWVLAGNARAIRFYESHGFAVEPDSAKTFELGGARLDEIRMHAPLAGEPPPPVV